MKVLVTGHHGYIGSVMVGVLGRAGHDVTGWINNETRTERDTLRGASRNLWEQLPLAAWPLLFEKAA